MTLTPSARSNRRKKIFHELDVHHVQKVRIKSFWPQEAEMTLRPRQFARIGEKKILMNSTYIMSRKWESKVFGHRRPK